MPGHLSEPTVEFSTWVELLRWRTHREPERRAYTYLIDGEQEGPHLTYAELDRQARAIGALLQSSGAHGERALLLYPPGLEFVTAFLGCLYGGVVAVPVYPPDPARFNRTLPRLQAIVEDAQPLVALTTSPILSLIEALLPQAPEFRAMRCLATDNLAEALAEEWRDPALGGDALALLQYTSGSTAAPKGVMLSHGNLLYNERMIQRGFHHTDQSMMVGWLPLYHDMGLIGNVLQPLYVGFPCILMSPLAFLQRPFRWLQAISRYRGTSSGAPNFAYDLCVRKIPPDQRASLDLRSWSKAFNGAEPVREDTLDRFATAFEACGFRREAFYPCYGLAEATLFVSGGLEDALPVVRTVRGTALEHHRVVEASTAEGDVRTLVSCGRTLLDQEIVIVHPESLTRRQPNQVGEIWVAGPNIAQGYWNRPGETEHTLRAYLADTGEGPFLRTGDLGFLKDGELFVAGRLKDLIIVGGQNHYPQDIERTVEQSHPALRPGCCAAFSVDGGGEERLVVMAEVDRRYEPVRERGDGGRALEGELEHSLEAEVVVRAVRRAVADQHDVHVSRVLLLKAGSIPKTSSGKIQRHACRASFLEGTADAWEG